MPTIKAWDRDLRRFVEVKVSRRDHKAASRHPWRISERGYAYRKTSVRVPGRKHPVGVRVLLHRWVCGLERGDPRVPDHLNRDKLDNRRSNLEVVTQLENTHRHMIQDGRMRDPNGPIE